MDPIDFKCFSQGLTANPLRFNRYNTAAHTNEGKTLEHHNPYIGPYVHKGIPWREQNAEDLRNLWIQVAEEVHALADKIIREDKDLITVVETDRQLFLAKSHPLQWCALDKGTHAA